MYTSLGGDGGFDGTEALAGRERQLEPKGHLQVGEAPEPHSVQRPGLEHRPAWRGKYPKGARFPHHGTSGRQEGRSVPRSWPSGVTPAGLPTSRPRE